VNGELQILRLKIELAKIRLYLPYQKLFVNLFIDYFFDYRFLYRFSAHFGQGRDQQSKPSSQAILKIDFTILRLQIHFFQPPPIKDVSNAHTPNNEADDRAVID
jgi:hypothetical protein